MGDSLLIEPLTGPLDARPRIPGSKSFTNRALIVAALAKGSTNLDGVLLADDTEAMLGCLSTLGVPVDLDRERRRVAVHGVDGVPPSAPGVALDARQSGTTARFVLPMLALGAGTYVVDSAAQLRARPMADLVEALTHIGVNVSGAEGDRLPITVTGSGSVRGGKVRLPGHTSSQFLSGLLLSAPYFRDGLTVELTSELVSKPYLDVTMSTMRSFGVEVANDAYQVFDVPPGRYGGRDLYRIEPDASAASYFLAAAVLCGGRVTIDGLGDGAVQGDVRFADILGRMGAVVSRAGSVLTVESPPDGRLRGITVDMADCSDTAQTLAVVAAFAATPTRVSGIGFIRRKETDRIGAVVAELRRCGVDAHEEADGFVVRPVPGAPHGASVHTYDDHRMAMSFSLIGLRVPGIEILDPRCVAKTFPDYFDVLASVRPRPHPGAR